MHMIVIREGKTVRGIINTGNGEVPLVFKQTMTVH